MIIAARKFIEDPKTSKDQRVKNFSALLAAIVHGKMKIGAVVKTHPIGWQGMMFRGDY